MSPVATSKFLHPTGCRHLRRGSVAYGTAADLASPAQRSVRFLSTRAALYARSWAEMAGEARLACTIRPMSSLEFTKARRDAESHAQPVAGMLRSTRHRANHGNLRNGGRKLKESVMPRQAGLLIFTTESGLTRYLKEIRRSSMLEPQLEYMLAKRWREHGDRHAAHKLVASHCAWSPRSPWAIAATGCRSPR